MEISDIDVILSPKEHLPENSDELRLAAGKAVDSLNDKLATLYNRAEGIQPHLCYVVPIRWPDHRDGNFNHDAPKMTGEYAFGIQLDRRVTLTPTFTKRYIDFLLTHIGDDFRLDDDCRVAGKVTSHDLRIPHWVFFPHEVEVYKNPKEATHSHVDASIEMEGIALNAEHREILKSIGEEVCFPAYTRDFAVDDTDAMGRIPTWLEQEGSGQLKSYNPRYGDNCPIIVVRRRFHGELNRGMETEIEDWHNHVRDASLQARIPTAYLDLQLAQPRRQWLQENGVDLVKEVSSASAFNNGVYGFRLRINYHLEKADGKMVLSQY